MKTLKFSVPLLVIVIGSFGLRMSAQTSVSTHHYDNRRTGWNNAETVLTPASVWSPQFALLHNVTLDEQVDAQPLVVPGVSITAGSYQGVHDVVYVATENNTVYAIDVHSGTILLSMNLGAPVPSPLGCNNNGPYVGINSTPVIDLVNKLLYVMAYTNSGPTYTLYGLDLGSLSKKVSTTVSASHTLTDGTTFTFNAKYQRQRPALLLANGYVYAGFGSFCDYSPNLSRGWLLGWAQGTLTPLAHNELIDTQATDSGSYFLSSIWMSGYGPATDDAGNILFVTGNSDKSVNTYDGITDVQESVVKVKYDLSTMIDHFTPSDQFSLDQGDTDFGSGGVLVLPDQPGSIPHMAVAAGKDGNMFLMNEDNLGGFSSTKNNVLGTYSIGNCWCGESYYVDPTDGLGRVVTSGGTGSPTGHPAQANQVEVWKVQTSPTATLSNVASGQVTSSLQDPGFFTSVSSNGNSNPVIWAVSRPLSSNSPTVNLYAFDPDEGGSILSPLATIFAAGSWPNTNGNANLVPVVANGQVYVASNKQLQIFGLTGSDVRIQRTAGTGANVACSYPAYSTTYWSPLSAVSSFGSYATAEVGNNPKGPINSQCLYATGFSFSLPTNATILGVEISFLGYVYSGTTAYFKAQLLNNGAPVGTSNQTNYITSTSAAGYTLGAWNSLWGTTWTPTSINQSNFGVSIQAIPQAGSWIGTAAIGGVQIAVFYQP